ncbi:MAG: DUF4245 family protein [Mycobacteriales bacterium]
MTPPTTDHLTSAPARPALARRFAGVADMARSLSVVLAFAFAVLFVGAGRALLFPSHRNGPSPVDYQTQVRLAASSAGTAFLAPPSLPRGWQATIAEVSPGAPVTLRVGFTLPGSGFVALVEQASPSLASSRSFCARQLGNAALCRTGRSISIGGRGWASTRDSRGQAALLLRQDRLTVVLISTVGPTPLRTLADRLS